MNGAKLSSRMRGSGRSHRCGLHLVRTGATVLGLLILTGMHLGASPLSLRPADRGSSTPLPACEDGVILDDGSLETGYGWVPSVVDGRYVQVFQSTDFAEPGLESVCICWTRTRMQDSIDFSVELYRLGEEGPLAGPEVSMPARAEAVPMFPQGQFFEISLPSPPLPAGQFAIGVRWNPSLDQFFFVCADQSPGTPFTNGWLIDDRAQAWAQFLDSPDSVFQDHAAMLVRAVPGDPILPIEVPSLGWWSRLVLGCMLALVGALAVRQMS